MKNEANQGIGTLNESPLHSYLKNRYEPRQEMQEVKVGSYIADIANEEGCIEIQTRNFGKMKKKLAALLEQGRVTLVYPVAQLKWVMWIDPDTGEVSKPRKSPKKTQPADVFYELQWIKELLDHPNLRLMVVSMEIEEYKNLDGWGKDKKRNATRATRVPVRVFDELLIQCPKDYALLLPQGLPEEFTTQDLAKLAGLSRSTAQVGARLLRQLGVIEQVGKKGRSVLYAVRTENR